MFIMKKRKSCLTINGTYIYYVKEQKKIIVFWHYISSESLNCIICDLREKA